MATKSKMLHVRVDDEIKTQAAETLEAMGLTMSEAIKLFLHRVVIEQGLPFEMKVPNAKTKAAMAEADEIVEGRRARFGTAKKLLISLEKDSKK